MEGRILKDEDTITKKSILYEGRHIPERVLTALDSLILLKLGKVEV